MTRTIQGRYAHRSRSRAMSLVAACVAISLAMVGCSKASEQGSTGGSTPQPGNTQGTGGLSHDEIMLLSSVITSGNDYQQEFLSGSEAFAKSVGLELTRVVSEGDSQRQLSQIQAAIASGKKVVMVINPIASADMPAVVKAVSDSGGFISSTWNKPDSLRPEDFTPNYVTHIGYDGIAAGQQTAEALFKAMGGSGGVLAIRGVLDSTADKQRWEGLQRALANYPDIELLGSDNAEWDQQTALTKTQSLLAKHGDNVKGIWTACDAMTLGAIAAADAAKISIKASGIDGITEALTAVNEGDTFVATWASQGKYYGALGLAISYAAATGSLDVAAMTPDQRDGTWEQLFVDKSNVADFLTPLSDEELVKQINDGLFSSLVGPAITDEELTHK